MDNKSLQADEIEALSAIYGDDWSGEDMDNHVFSIILRSEKSDIKSIKMQIRLPEDYPLSGPPFYTLSAPWMSKSDKYKLTSELDLIYYEQPGESIIYQWIEKAREFLTQDITNSDSNCSDKTSDDNKEDEIKYDLEGLKEENKYKYNSHKHHNNCHNNNGNNDVVIYHGEPIIDRRSTFQAHLTAVSCVEQVNEAIQVLLSNKKIAGATHNIRAYRIMGSLNHSLIQDCDDDGESHAGSRLLHLLNTVDAKNVLVVVTRWYGGTNLGADRFKHINNAARDLLSKCGYLDSNNEESTHSGKKKKSK